MSVAELQSRFTIAEIYEWVAFERLKDGDQLSDEPVEIDPEAQSQQIIALFGSRVKRKSSDE